MVGKKRIFDHTYQITDDIKLTLREGTTDTFILWETFKLKTYEYPGFEINHEDIVVDIGGHIGIFAVYAARKANKGLL